MSKSNSTDPVDIYAAGCVCWRIRGGNLQVLLIHRPRSDDWSWPKGKQDNGETLPETAVRELREETGLRVRLGIPLADVRYRAGSKRKLVRYWAAEIPAGVKPTPDRREVDAASWVSPAKARKMLTNSKDIAPLDTLEAHARTATLATRPVIVVRHAKAMPRSSWQRAEGDRPLAATGKRQALAVTRLLAAWSPQRVVTSPWLRCMSTVVPYATKNGIKVKERKVLTEAAHKRNPAKAAAEVAKLFEKDHSTVLCTHRPVLPTVLSVLAQHLAPQLADHLPTSDPYLTPGQMIVLHVPRTNPGRAISCEVISPFDD